MTLEEAIKTDRELILTIEPPDGSEPFKAVMVRPYCLFADGLLYGEMRDGTDWTVYAEFVSNVQLGDEIV